MTAYRRPGERRLFRVRDRLPDGYTARVDENDPEAHWGRYQAQLHRMWVTRHDGPVPASGEGNPHERGAYTWAYWQALDQPPPPDADNQDSNSAG